MMRTMVEGAQSSLNKILAFACAAVLATLVGFAASSIVAEDAYADEYEYTVTLYAGNGQIDGKDSVVVGTYGYGDSATVDWTKYDITLPDDRYYVKGVRLAGHDDSSVAAPNFIVKENTQYVVAYGLKKDQTNYTVKYVDADGNELLETQTFQGNVGDKPVVAYQYIEGYEPQNALNMTGTLSKNEAANVFTFVYAPAAAADSEGDDAVAGGATADDEQAADEEGAAAEGEGAEEGTEAGPAELVDIDDEANPLANIGREDANGFSVASVLPWVFGVLVAAAIIALIALVVVRNRSAKQDA